MADYKFGIGERLRFHSVSPDLSHTWDFGDGTPTSSETSPVHIYTSEGIYIVTHTARDFCSTCVIAGSHTVEISQTSITVRSILLDKYVANIGDTVKITTVAQNLSSVYGTGSIVIKFDGDTISIYDVTLDTGQETTFDIERQITSGGTISICADSVCTMLSVESLISVLSVTVDNSISTGQLITATVTVKNDGAFTEEKIINTKLADQYGATAIIDSRLLSMSPGETKAYDVPIDAMIFPNGTYTICAENICKAISIAKISEISGSLSISSLPPGAEIYVDGESTGQFTNTTITNILSGPHSFRLTLAGYSDTFNNPLDPVIITGGMTTYIHTVLSPLALTTGSINITSDPAGANIYIDTVQQLDVYNQPLITPATISEILPGSRNITVKKTGYVDYSEYINVIVGQTTYAGILLRIIPTNIGNINFTSVPEGAYIFLDDESTGKLTNNTLANIEIGNHTFRLELAGRNPTLGNVTVVGGVTAYVNASLSLISSTIGGLNIVSYPSDADILIDDSPTLAKTPILIENLPTGINYSITLKKEGYDDFRANVGIVAGQTWYIGATLIKTVSTTQVQQAGMPWWIIGGLAIGMFYTAKKSSEAYKEAHTLSLMAKQGVPQLKELPSEKKGKIVTLTKKGYKIK